MITDYLFKAFIEIIFRYFREHELVIDNSVDNATIISVRIKRG